MKSWIFSDNDQITQPLSGDEAVKYVAQHPNAYAWRPTFTHWMPVTYIADFSDVVKAPKAPSIVPQELIESFIVKEKALVKKLGILDTKIVNAINSLTEFDTEVNYYKELTKDCNLDVQETLDNIERQYARLQANLKNFTQTASSDKKSFSNTVSDFNTSTASATPRNESSSLPTPSPTETITEQVESEPDPVVEQVETVTLEESIVDEPVIEELVVAERVVKQSDRVSSSTANKAAASLSELVSDATPESIKPSVRVKKLTPVEFSENITAEDLAITAKIQSMTVDADMASSYDKHNMEDNAEGDFDYILKGKYVDDGSIGSRVDSENGSEENEDDELVTELDDEPKKRKRRRRR